MPKKGKRKRKLSNKPKGNRSSTGYIPTYKATYGNIDIAVKYNNKP